MRKKLTTTLAATHASMYKCYHASGATHWMLSMIVLVMLATVPSSVLGGIAKGVFAASSGEKTVVVRKVSAVATGNQQSDADTLIYKYTFPTPTFEEHNDGTITVRMNGVENFGGVGDPSFPTLAVRLAIPKGRELLSVECDGELEQVATGVVLRHVYRPVPTSVSVSSTNETERNEVVYGSNELFPERCYSEHNIASKRGVRFVDFNLTPVKYRGLTGEVWYCPEITVMLSLMPQGSGAPKLTSASGNDAPSVRSKDDADAAMLLLDNPDEVASYVPTNSVGVLRTGTATLASMTDYASIPYVHPTLPCRIDSNFPSGYKHVIVTSQALLDAFEQLVMYRRGQGVSSTAVTVEQIASNYSGRDTQEKIRNFIKDAYTTWNAEYIVLGGDTGHVPARSLYCYINSSTNDNIPSDLYYQCLDGDFNADGDSVWGETNDEIDYYAEVAIGRVSAESAIEVNNWLSKLEQYNTDVLNGESYTKAMLSVGEYLGFQGLSAYASGSMDQIMFGGTYDGYSTKGFRDSNWYSTTDTLYESPSYEWNGSDIVNLINKNKYAVINHLGHSEYSINMKIVNSQSDVGKWTVNGKVVDSVPYTQLKNTAPIFVYSQGCVAGSFDKDCIAEKLTTSSGYGCWGGVWNARYGWGAHNSTDSASQKVARQFWNAVFTTTETKNGMIGLANQLSHDRNASYASKDAYGRWVLYETNLFGDPIQQIDGVTLSGGGSQLQISKPLVSFSSSGGPGSADVTASSSWTVTASDSWIVLTTTGGSGNGTIEYSVLANTGTSERTGSITVKSGTVTATQRITQSAESARLNVSPTVSDFGCDTGNGSFDVYANYSWTVEKSASWIKLNTAKGIGNGKVSYSVDENTGTRRTGTITVKIGSLTATHTVTQMAPPQLTLNPEAETFSADAGNGTITVTADSMWTASKSATWINLSNTEGNGNGTITYGVLENTGSQRQGWIYVKSGSVQRSFLVTQNRRDSVTFSEESANVPADGGTGTFTVTIFGNNRSIGVTASTVPWAAWTFESANLTEGTRYTFSYDVLANTSLQRRTTKIPIYIYFNGTNYYFTITQSPHVNNFLVTYRPGANGSGAEAYDIKQKNISLTLRGAIFSRTGYTQKGWSTTDGGGRVYDLGASYTKNEATTLYPYWEPGSTPDTTYTIRFSPGPYGSGHEQTAVKYKGVAFTLPGALYTRDGYEQTGWSVFSSGTSKTYELGGIFGNDIASTFYPYWTEVPEEDPSESDFGFYIPSGWKTPIYLCTTNTEWWTYAPQYVFSQGDSLRVNYCINNYSETQTVNVNSRLISLVSSDGETVTSLSESFEGDIQPLYRKHYRSANVNNWLSQCAPGNYAIKMTLDPFDELNDVDKSDNMAVQWFAVKAEGITLNEALNCGSLYFTDNGTMAFPQTSESVVGGSCVQLGPQSTNSFDSSVLWAYVTEPGTLTFKWKATSQDGFKAFLGCYVNGDLVKYKWAEEHTEWEEAFVTIDTAPLWVCWRLGTDEPDSAYLTAGWVDCVTWSGDAKKPTFTVDSSGKLTGVELNGVTDLEIPSIVNSIAVRAIGACVLTNTAITSVSIPNTVTNIGYFAFYNNPYLTGITIPGSVLGIDESAFNACSSLKSVVLNEGVKTIGDYAFYNCGSLSTVTLPASLTAIGQSPFGNCGNLNTISVAPGNLHYFVENNALIEMATRTLIQYPSGRIEGEYEIPEGLFGIGYDAFDTVTHLTKITIPASVTALGSFSFWQCQNLQTIVFKGNAPSVGDYAFSGVASSCKALVSPQSTGWGVYIPGTWCPAELSEIGIEYSAALQTYTVSYEPGAEGTGSPASEVKSHGITLPLKGATYTRAGYLQTGWSTSDGGTKAYELGASYTANAAVTLYPYWEANAYSVGYELDEGTAGASAPASVAYGTAFRVSAPTREGYVFMGWMVTSGLEITTARYGESESNQSTEISNASQQCFNGSDVDVWFVNLTPVADGNVTLTATWEPVVDDSRDIGFYAPADKGWTFPVCLSSTNIDYLAYAPETEFVQFSDVCLSFCAVNWSTVGSALLQSTLLTVTDENGNIFDQGEPIQLKPLGAFGYGEVRNMSLRRYMSGITPGRYKLTLELDPNRLLVDPDRSNNTTSIWFTVTAPTDPIPELPTDATTADVRIALAGSADGRLVENISDVSTYTAYREWARGAKGSDNKPVGVAVVKTSDKAWLSFAVDSPKLIDKEIVRDDVKIEDFVVASNGGQFDFTVGITDVTIGDGATMARLKTVFGIEGATSLDNSVFSSDNLTLETAEPEHGKVKLTVKPAAPKTGNDPSASAFFMRVKVN